MKERLIELVEQSQLRTDIPQFKARCSLQSKRRGQRKNSVI